MKYKILPHTADGKFQAYGRSLEEAFVHAALAMVSLMWDWSKVELKMSRQVRLRGRDREQLLVNYLSEIIFLLETKRFLTAGVTDLTIREGHGEIELEAVFRGDTISADIDIFGDVKAVTYHEMKIEENDGFLLQVVVDM